MVDYSRPQWILFLDGKSARLQVFLYGGACLAGDPTAYCYRGGKFTWIKPGDSVTWIEAA